MHVPHPRSPTQLHQRDGHIRRRRGRPAARRDDHGRDAGQRTRTCAAAGTDPNPASPRLQFGVIGVNHNHIYSMTTAVIRGGGELTKVFAKEPELLAAFLKRFPQAKTARDRSEILEDPAIQLVLSSAIPDERAPLGIRVMQHGKDYMADKPGITTLEQLAEVRRVQAQTKRIYSIIYSERFENRATVKAGELVKAGAIGKVDPDDRPGPASDHPGDAAGLVLGQAAVRRHPVRHRIAPGRPVPLFHRLDAGRGRGVAGGQRPPSRSIPSSRTSATSCCAATAATGYIRVDWFTPDGLSTWGDGRLTILGTDGFIEIRKNVDIAGRPGESHLFLVDQKETRYVDCTAVTLPYGGQLVADVLNRTETAMPQAHCFLATELMLKAQAASAARRRSIA